MAGFKYKSLNVGAGLAEGSFLFFLDADCLVPKGYDELIKKALNMDDVVGGAFEFQIEQGGFMLFWAQWFNRTRYRITQNYFGDQGVFCRKETYARIGGYPDQPIMEAAFFCRNLRKIGKLKLINSPVISSVRRFEKGVFSVLLKDALIWVQFLIGMDIKKHAKGYWKENKERF